MKRTFALRSAVTVALLVALLCQGTRVLAGTTGGLSGTVTDQNGKPIPGVAVKATSPSQIATTTTDTSGHFVFLSLAPDTYTVSLEKANYENSATAGVTVFADQSQTLSLVMHPTLKTIAKVTSTQAGALIRGGTTSDVYSVNSATASKVTGLGGGGGLDNAYSAIATMPGAYVPVGQMGWFQTVYIRGGDYDQVGYEVDGVPVNRSFDSYPSNTATSLGQQEVQVYTGAAPADAQGQGLAGYINQVIKTGTYPGYATSDIGIGAPTFYHKANVEVGGATPDRLFSYYVGLGGYNQQQRVYDQFDGASISNTYGSAFTNCPAAPAAGLPSCYVNGAWLSGSPGGVETPGYVNSPFSAGVFPSTLTDRDTVMNFHFGIPHKHDSGRDDLQLLYETSSMDMYLSNSINDFGGLFSNPALGLSTSVPYQTGNIYTGAMGEPVDLATVGSSFKPYLFPFSQGPTIPLNNQDDEEINDAIIKVQYQKNFSGNAYLRVYGYTDYSNWLNYGPNGVSYYLNDDVDQYTIPADYVVSSHTFGGSAEFADQLNSKDMIELQASYTTASSERTNSFTAFESNGSQFATLVSAANPNAGICYTPAGVATGCSTQQGYAPGNVTIGAAAAQGAGAFPAITGTCGGAPCEWLATENGYQGEYNDVTPQFYSMALTDSYDPTDRLHFNFGVRYDNFGFVPNSTSGGARNFWFNAWNNSMCYDRALPGSSAVPLPAVSASQNAQNGACAAELGADYVPATLSNNVQTNVFQVWQPRIGMTYTVNPLNVIRASYGRYDQAPSTAFEEYDTLQQDLPDYLGPTFFGYGRTSPTYPIAPEVSNNYDLSWEHQIKGTDWSFKITPFYRQTQDQIEDFFLNVTTGFVSGLNIGQQTNRGFEFDLQKGSFSRNGLSGLLAFTYTNAYVKYGTLTSGSSVLTTINSSIQGYNQFTSACNHAGANASLCGSGYAAAYPCYTTAGAGIASAAACGAADVANPYWNAAPQALFNPNGDYAPYDLFPFTPGAGDYTSFVTPYVATLVLNYKHNKWAITPALQFSAGNRYGYPLADTGYNPSTCSAVTGFAIGQVYYGGAGGYGNAADPASCTGMLYIPDVSTGRFDDMGAFVTPSRYTLSVQITYDISPRLEAVATLANLVDKCAGGTVAPWTTGVVGVPSSAVCGYGPSTAVEYGAPVGNVAPLTATGGELAQAQTAYAYTPTFGSLPFNAYFDLRIRL